MTAICDTPTTRFDLDLICRIHDRAVKELTLNDDQRRNGLMDLMFCHKVNPLNLELFLAFNRMDFSHDFHGITANFDRRELRLDNFFSPRCDADSNPRTPHTDTVEQQDADAMVAEWVGQHYLINFQACSVATKQAWRERYKEMHK